MGFHSLILAALGVWRTGRGFDATGTFPQPDEALRSLPMLMLEYEGRTRHAEQRTWFM